jgi:hypothetical protein
MVEGDFVRVKPGEDLDLITGWIEDNRPRIDPSGIFIIKFISSLVSIYSLDGVDCGAWSEDRFEVVSKYPCHCYSGPWQPSCLDCIDKRYP